ncbi:hypothetical protein HDV06_002612 [Boothiomyces sp. JEL0866]|nr:hypothetical protein HDV06_002612 [Boothiomyces sp. JEL0866]
MAAAILCMLYLISLVAAQCPPLSPHTPQSITDLRPDDFKIIAALGDSITAGYAEYRGKSWAMGGDPNAVTLPNFIKQFNPNLIGASVGQHFANFCEGILCPPFEYHPEYDHFNAARSGAYISNLDGELNWLIEQMEVTNSTDYKLLNLFAGNNDACHFCWLFSNLYILDADQFEKSIIDLLHKMEDNIPNLIVNIHLQPRISRVYQLTVDAQHCIDLRNNGTKHCSCAFQSDKERRQMDDLIDSYNSKLLKVQNEYQPKQNFMIIIDPMFRDLDLSSFSIDYISPIDCFHPSLKAHELFAKAAWNNLFFSFDEKNTTISEDVQVICPNDESRIRQ